MSDKKNSKYSIAIGILAFCLLMSVIFTTVIVSNVLESYTIKDSEVIQIGNDDVVEDIIDDSNEEVEKDETYYSSSRRGHWEIIEKEFGIDVEDDEQVWMAVSNIDLFDKSYTNSDGMLTVDSSNSENVIAPGTEKSYTFWIKNTGEVKMNYTVKLDCFFELEGYEIPVELRLKDANGTYILGDENTWVKSARDIVTYQNEVLVNRYHSYTLDWRWAYEGNDEFDTLLGDYLENEKTKYNATILVLSEPGEKITDKHWVWDIIDTATTETASIYLLGMVGSLALLLILLLLRRKKDDEHEEVNE